MKNNEKGMAFTMSIGHNQSVFLPPEASGNARSLNAPFHLLVWDCFGQKR